MTYRTVIVSSFDCYFASDDDSLEERSAQRSLRAERLLRFPYSAMLQVAFPELDFVNRWCWMNFGVRNGECTQKYSQYRVCEIPEPHHHSGGWTDHWFVKTSYDFGFNEWYFADASQYNAFLRNVPEINWGELYSR